MPNIHPLLRHLTPCTINCWDVFSAFTCYMFHLGAPLPFHFFFFFWKNRAKSSAAGVEAFACISGCAAVFMTPLLFRKPFLWIRKGRPTTLYFQKEIMSKHFAAYRIHKSCNNWQHLGVLSDETFSCQAHYYYHLIGQRFPVASSRNRNFLSWSVPDYSRRGDIQT